MLTLLALLFGPAQATDALDRCAAFLKGAKSLSVEIKAATLGNQFRGSGTLYFERPYRTAFRYKTGAFEYRLTSTEHGTSETEASRRLYDEGASLMYLGAPPSRI